VPVRHPAATTCARLLRGGASDADLASAIGHIWQGRGDRYSELRSSCRPTPAAASAASR
jgi:cyclic pyranopterin phosphate synthase